MPILSPRTNLPFPFHNLKMSGSTPQISTTLGNYSFARNPPTHQRDQHNKNINFGSTPPAMGSNHHEFQMLGPNDSSSSASSQHIATMSDMHTIAPMVTNSNIPPWTSDSPLSRNDVLHGSPHTPLPHDLGGARSSASSRPAMGRVYLSPHALPTPGPIGHTSPGAMSSQRSMTASDARSIVPVMVNSNATSWVPVNFTTAASDDWSQCVTRLHNPGGARSEAPSHPEMGRVYLPPHAFQMPGPIGHTSPVSSQCGMSASDIHYVVPMIENPSAMSWTPGNLRTAVSHGPSQSVPCIHDLGGVNSSLQFPPAQLELSMNQPSPLLCRWVYNDVPCGYEGTLEDLKQHWHDNHLPGYPGAMIQCQWKHCNYHKRGDPSINVMCRSSVWRHISEVHLMHRRNN